MLPNKVVEAAVIDTKAVEDVNKIVEVEEKTTTIPYIKEDFHFRHGVKNYVFKKGQRNVEVPVSVLTSIVNAGKF